MNDSLARAAQEVARRQHAIEDIELLLGRGAEYLASSYEARCRLKSPAAFKAAIEWECQAAAKTGDELGILEIRLDRELATMERVRIVEQLRTLASRAGEEIGQTERGGYAVMIPWASPSDMQTLTDIACAAATSIAPDAAISSGWCLTRDADDTPTLEPFQRPRVNALQVSRSR